MTNNNKDIKLNEYIFNSLSIYLMNSDCNSFKRLLEYSLLSKHCFSVFQSLILSHKRNKFIFPLDHFTEYIILDGNSNNEDEDKYKYQLIQFKDIERIKVPDINSDVIKFLILKKFQKKRKRDDDENNNNNKYNEEKDKILNGICKGDDNIVLKRFLNYFCPNLKKVTILEKQQPFFHSRQNCTFGGFFKFIKLSMYFDGETTPESYEELEEDNTSSSSTQVTHITFNYSFQFISNYNPNKIYISTSKNEDLSLELENINNILNFKSIKSIEFETDFIKYVTGIGIESNISIRKLILRQHLPITGNKRINIEPHNNNNNNTKVSEFFDLIKHNSTLKSIGLEYFNIELKNSYLLSPLIQMTNISSLSCGSFSLKLYFNHCNQNSNIRKLVIYEQDPIYYIDKKDETLNLFEQFIINNTSSLQIIKIVYLACKPLQSLIDHYNYLLNKYNYNNTEKGSKYLKLIHDWNLD